MVAHEDNQMNSFDHVFCGRLTENSITAPLQLTSNLVRSYLAYWSGVYRYTNEFMLPFWTALKAFLTTDKNKLVRHQINPGPIGLTEHAFRKHGG